MNVDEIRRAFAEKRFRYTKHGLEQRIDRHISSQEIKQAIFEVK